MPTKIFDVNKFNGYTQNEKDMFEAHRDSMLNIFPKTNNAYDDEVVKICEDSAFIFVDKFPEEVKNPPPPVLATTPGTTGTTG